MNKILQKIKESFSYVGELKNMHPLTFTVLLAGTICFFLRTLFDGILDVGIVHDSQDALHTVLDHLGLWMTLFCLAVFFAEIVVPKTKKILLTAVIAIAAVVTFLHAGLLSGSFIYSKVFEDVRDRIGESELGMLTAGYVIIFSVLILFFCYRRASGEYSMADYLMGVISQEFLICVIYTVVMIGLATLTFIFTLLLFGEFEDLFLPLAVLITGIYAVGASVLVVAKGQRDVPKFVHVLFRYVLFGMSVVAYVIIYLYIKKIGGYYSEAAEDGIVFDATELAELLKSTDYKDRQEEYASQPLVYDQNDCHFVVTSASMSYDGITGDIENINAEGYLLR